MTQKNKEICEKLCSLSKQFQKFRATQVFVDDFLLLCIDLSFTFVWLTHYWTMFCFDQHIIQRIVLESNLQVGEFRWRNTCFIDENLNITQSIRLKCLLITQIIKIRSMSVEIMLRFHQKSATYRSYFLPMPLLPVFM